MIELKEWEDIEKILSRYYPDYNVRCAIELDIRLMNKMGADLKFEFMANYPKLDESVGVYPGSTCIVFEDPEHELLFRLRYM